MKLELTEVTEGELIEGRHYLIAWEVRGNVRYIGNISAQDINDNGILKIVRNLDFGVVKIHEGYRIFLLPDTLPS